MRSFILIAFIGSTIGWGAPPAPPAVENFLKNGSFEEPAISGRVLHSAGGSVVDASTWALFNADPIEENGRLLAGLTDEIARTGRQSLFVDFEKLRTPGLQAALRTKLVTILPGLDYRVSIWGRIDRQRPLALDERRPIMTLQVEFMQANQTTPAGEPTEGEQFIPGEIVPGGPHPLIFVSRKWTESFAVVSAPENAVFMRVTWIWSTPDEEGETDGVVFWDDATIVPVLEDDQKSPAGENPDASPSPDAAPAPAPTPR